MSKRDSDPFADPANKGIKGLLAGGAIFLAIFLAMHWPSGAPVIFSGVVESSGAISVARIKGATVEMARIRLADGTVITASVVSVGPLAPGDAVTVARQSRALGGPVYQVFARDLKR